MSGEEVRADALGRGNVDAAGGEDRQLVPSAVGDDFLGEA